MGQKWTERTILGLMEDTFVATPWTHTSCRREEDVRVRGVEGVVDMMPVRATLMCELVDDTLRCLV